MTKRSRVYGTVIVIIILALLCNASLPRLSFVLARNLASKTAPIPSEPQQPSSNWANGRFGINRVNDVNTLAHATDRYAKAKAIGATTSRWVLEWARIERYGDDLYVCPDPMPEPTWEWGQREDVIERDAVELGGEAATLLVLMGAAPKCYQATVRGEQVAAPIGLDAPIFRGYDPDRGGFYITEDPTAALPGIDGINPGNPWARFVYMAVEKYGEAVKYWQVWNEPNLEHFWAWYDQPDKYARLLEVAYFAAQHSGKEIKLVLGGLAGVSDLQNTDGLLRQLGQRSLEPEHKAFRYIDYLDIYALHSYNYPWGTLEYVRWFNAQRTSYDLPAKPIWLTESGVDFANSSPETRAAYVMQHTTYVLAMGFATSQGYQQYHVEKFFHFQLDNSVVCFGFPMRARCCGLFTGGPYYDETALPSYIAYQTLGTYLVDVIPDPHSPLYDPTPNNHNDVDHQEVRFISADPTHEKRITVLWATRQYIAPVAQVTPAYRDRWAKLVWQDGTTAMAAPESGAYRIALPPQKQGLIGGKTVMVIEEPDFPIYTPGDGDIQ